MRNKFNIENQLSLFGDDVAVMEPPAIVAVKSPVAKAVAVVTKMDRTLFVLEDKHLSGLTGPKAKVRANLEAIKIAVRKDGEIDANQKSTLAAYSGWGGLSGMFANTQEFAAERAEFQSLVSKEWFEAARESVLTAYYTEPEVIRAMWQMVRTMGFEGGKVLEPSAGTGNFIGAMPADMRQNSQVTLVEPDCISGRIAKDLYADTQTRVYHAGIEHAPVRADSFDLVIGNVPFGNYRVHDSKFDRLKLVIHDYFFAKSIDAVKPGGLVVLISSTGTLDKVQSKFREYIAERADLVTAIRLPSGAFSRLGSTEVSTDIVVLRKKLAVPDGFVGKEFAQTQKINWRQFDGGYSPVHACMNEFFHANLNCLLGSPKVGKSQYGEGVVYCSKTGWQDDLLALCSDRKTLSGLFKAVQEKPGEMAGRLPSGNTGSKSGLASGFFLDETGALQYLSGDYVESQQHLPTSTRLRIEGMTRIRDCAVELLEIESMGHDGAVKRAELNRSYDDFVSQHGVLMRPVNRRLFALDSHAPLLWSLERYDDENETAVKADIFAKSTVSRAVLSESAESIGDAIALSYNRYAKMDIAFMAKAMGSNEMDLVDKLISDGRVYLDPENSEYVDSEVYLSGKVLEKLDVARAASEGDFQFRKNVTALEAVVPATVPIESIGVQLGVPWIGARDVEDFVRDTVMCSGEEFSITHIKAIATWTVGLSKYLRKTALLSNEWGTPKKPFDDLLTDLLNQRSTTVYKEVEVTSDNGTKKTKKVVDQNETMAARDKADKIQKDFKDWVLADKDRSKRLENVYNRAFNGTVNRKYDGSHLVIPGLSSAISLRAAQKDAIWRGEVSGNALFAQAVGGGKTLILICLAQESKRLGLANKPMLAVPNHMLEAFAGEYSRAFPKARILAASKNDLDGEKRGRLLMRIATEDWDCVILTHSSLGKIAPSKDAVNEFADSVGEKLEESIREADDNNAVREAQRQKKMVVAKIMTLADTGKKDAGLLSFEKLGVDMLLVDEADLFKNLWFHTKKTRVSGLNSSFSGRALDLYMKSRIIFERRRDDGFGLVFATATPIANTIAEMFIMQTYLQPTRLKELGIDCFDAWAASFAREVTSIEVSPEGSGYRMHSRFAQFVNVPELMQVFREVAEIRTKAMLKLPEPTLAGGKHTIVAVSASEAQKAYVQSLVERAKEIRNGTVKPNEDNMLCVTGDGRKAALDMRCVDPWSVDHPGSKVNACIENVFHHWEDGQQTRLTQLLFCDMSTPKKNGFSVYQVVREKLIERGVPELEIAFAQDYDTDAQKAELHRKVRSGKIRVLVGSTELMGFGTNVQDRLIAEHHLDAPWRPRDVEQRDGRILRQGNLNREVWIYRYVTESTFDAYMWQTLERKAGFIAQVMEGTSEVRCVEDVTSQALSFAEVKAIASGNPLVIEKAGIDAEVAKIMSLKTVWRNNQRGLSDKVANCTDNIVFVGKRVAALELDTESTDNLDVVTVGGNVMGVSEASAKAVMSFMSSVKAAVLTDKHQFRKSDNVFSIGDFMVGVEIRGRIGASSYEYYAVGKSGMSFEFSLPYGAENILMFLQSKVLGKTLLDRLHTARESLKNYQSELISAQRELKKPFEYEERLVVAFNKQQEIDASLGLMSDDVSALQMTEEPAEA